MKRKFADSSPLSSSLQTRARGWDARGSRSAVRFVSDRIADRRRGPRLHLIVVIEHRLPRDRPTRSRPKLTQLSRSSRTWADLVDGGRHGFCAANLQRDLPAMMSSKKESRSRQSTAKIGVAQADVSKSLDQVGPRSVPLPCECLGGNGGVDGTRTRGLCRDSVAVFGFSTTYECVETA